MSRPAVYLSAPCSFRGAELVNCSELGDHICGNVAVVAGGSGEKTLFTLLNVTDKKKRRT